MYTHCSVLNLPARVVLCLIACVLMVVPLPSRAGTAINPFGKIKHFVIIYVENRSFDGVFGDFPGADGLASAQTFAPQSDTDGTTLAHLPPVHGIKAAVDPRFPVRLPNAPFDIGAFVPPTDIMPDLVHRFYQEQEQINGGRNDRFAAVSDAGGLVMGTYAAKSQHLAALARDYTLADHFHHAAFGGSFLNHFFLVCACVPRFEAAPAKLIAVLDPATGWLARKPASPKSALDGPPVWLHDGQVTPDFFAVNTLQPSIAPFSDKTPPQERLPPQTLPTIGDRLSAKGLSWAWYASGWAGAVAGKIKVYAAPDYFQPHHQPFNYFAAYAPGTKARTEHLKDGAEFLAAIAAGTLPAVAFYKPTGRDNLHPGYATLAGGDAHVADIIAAIMAGPDWADTAIIVTADENGGTWDHVPPPKGDRWGPGLRVPALVISPFARRGFVDHTVYDTTAILKTIEVRFGLAALGQRDGAMTDLRNAFLGSVAGPLGP